MICNCIGPVGNCPCMQKLFEDNDPGYIDRFDVENPGYMVRYLRPKPAIDFIYLNYTVNSDGITFTESTPMFKPFSQRMAENLDNLLNAIKLHIRGTLDPNYHYVAGGTQTIDTWESRGSLSTTALDTATKYLDRYGKKEGKNPKDLLKAVHYILMAYQKDIVEDERAQQRFNSSS